MHSLIWPVRVCAAELRYGFQGLESKISLLSNSAGCLFGLEAFFVNIYFHDFSVKNYFQPFIV